MTLGCLSIGWLVGWSVCVMISVIFSKKKGGKFHFHAPIGALTKGSKDYHVHNDKVESPSINVL